MNLFVVIPAYNESEVIAKTIADVKKYCQNVIVVDDGSTDGTAGVAPSAGALVLRHIVNRGQGAALRTGINYALRNGADIVVTFDADGQFESAEIEKIIAPIISGECDIVLGSRFLQNNEIPFLRRLMLISATAFTRFISGLKISDTHNGFRALGRMAATKIKIRQDRMAHSSEIIQEIGRLGLKYKEIPVTVKYTDYSCRKGQKLSGAWRILFDMILK